MTARSCVILLLALTLPSVVRSDDGPAFERKEDVVYGRKHGMALTLDVFTPSSPNGLGLVWVVSGGWFSAHEAINPAFLKPFLARGYTVFAVVHGSQPRFTIPEILLDMHRAVRFIRHHAGDYHIDPERIGIFGASAGGHLSLMQGLAGDAGNPEAKDLVDRQSSRVAAVAGFFPPTDFLNYGKTGENALGRGILKGFQAPFAFSEIDPSRNAYVPITDENRILELGRKICPVYQVSDDDPPVLLIHGDADKLVPLQQSELVVTALEKAGVETKLIVKPGAEHGWPGLDKDLETFADWFDTHLRKPEADEPAPAAPPPPSARRSSAEQPPRKVVVGTAIFSPSREPLDLAGRLETLTRLIDTMAARASQTQPNRSLDLAVLPENAVNFRSGPPTESALPLEGPVQDTFSALARKHHAYLLVPMLLRETRDDRPIISNAAVLFDRSGQVAGIYRKVHPVAYVGSSSLEGGVAPGRDFPVFDCDFGRLGVQICWDVQFDEGWDALARAGADLVAWPSASPATVLPASHAARHRYHVVSSVHRDNATIYDPIGMVAARIEPPEEVLVEEIDLSCAVLGWSGFLDNGRALTDRFGDQVGFRYSSREDAGLFWSNDPSTPIARMVQALGGEEIDAQVSRNRVLYDQERSGRPPAPAASLRVSLRKTDDSARVALEGPGATVSLASPSGIGSATLHRSGDRWPHPLVVSIELEALESLSITAGSARLRIEVPSRPDAPALASRLSAQGEQPLDPDHPIRPALERTPAGFTVTLPPALLEAADDTITLDWINHYR